MLQFTEENNLIKFIKMFNLQKLNNSSPICLPYRIDFNHSPLQHKEATLSQVSSCVWGWAWEEWGIQKNPLGL